MKIETQPLDDHQVKLTLEVEPEAVEAAKHKAARHLSQRSKIPGFRPGKAPYQVILRQYGEGAIFEDAIEHLVEDLYPQMIEEAEINPYGPGQLEKVVSMDPMVLEFVVPLQAQVTLGDYTTVRVPFTPPEIGQDAVDTLMQELRERQAVLETVERPAQPEDVVELKIRGERMNPEEGQNPVIIEEITAAILIKAEDAELDLKEWPYPGFSVNLAGKSAGDEFTVEQSLPDDLEFAELRGVSARFSGVIETVKSRTLPELNDEFATMVSDKDNLDALTADIKNMLEFQGKQDYFDEYDNKVLDAAVELSEFKYPPQMIENEIDQFVESFKRRLKNEELDFDLY
ncbi:MAG TPA: trigger factor, partial [Anaerolineales bacterium]|nr:trigger factor [Anaerolineales bacterium]